jgi:hypothetical protein
MGDLFALKLFHKFVHLFPLSVPRCQFVSHAGPSFISTIWVEFMAMLLLVVTNAGSSSGNGNYNLFSATEIWPSAPFVFLLRSVAAEFSPGRAAKCMLLVFIDECGANLCSYRCATATRRTSGGEKDRVAVAESHPRAQEARPLPTGGHLH